MEVNLYEELVKRKNNGEKLNFDLITYDEMYNLFRNSTDGLIAELFGVSKYKVTKKRHDDFGITLIGMVMDDVFAKMNEVKNDKQ